MTAETTRACQAALLEAALLETALLETELLETALLRQLELAAASTTGPRFRRHAPDEQPPRTRRWSPDAARRSRA
jgi:hypothetical protein